MSTSNIQSLLNLDNYDYYLPKESIALEPAINRSESRLLVCDPREFAGVSDLRVDSFRNLSNYLNPSSTTFIINQTKVVPSRSEILLGPDKVKIQILISKIYSDKISFLSPKKIALDTKIYFSSKLSLKVIAKNKQEYHAYFIIGSSEDLLQYLNCFGKTPLPPYLSESKLSENHRKARYQAIWAKDGFSSAAPTASLHFDQSLKAELEMAGAKFIGLRLDVGLGTFAKISQIDIDNKKLHQEYLEIKINDYQTILSDKKVGRKIICVGTTALRALESLANLDINIPKTDKGMIGFGTDIFIRPGDKFKLCDGLITNFHVPKSSLMLLVEAFLRDGGNIKNELPILPKIYEFAIKSGFNFLSFGDAMLVYSK